MLYRNSKDSLKEDELEVELINWNSNGKLGFSITGGVGSQHIRGDNGIYVKSIQEGGLISWDGRIWVGDQLVAVKQGLDGERVNLNNVSHDHAVAILRQFCGGKRVVLIVKKSEVNLINWNKNDQLGFSISGGVNREHIPGDNRIYITNVVEGGNASKDGRLSVGDRLLAVKQNLSSKGIRSEDFFLMNHCTHEAAVSALQEARKGKKVILIIRKYDSAHPRLRFDDKIEESSSRIQYSTDPQTFAFGQSLLPKATLLPHVSSKAKLDGPSTKSILKCKKSLEDNKSYPDEGLGDTPGRIKKAIRIKYVSGEPISQEDLSVTKKNGEGSNVDKTELRFNDSVEKVTNPLPKHSGILNSSGSSTSSSSSMYDYDSALSSMSSEDESHFLDFSDVTKVISQINTPKLGHSRQKSRHVIEHEILKSDAPVSYFSRPALDKDRMFSSPPALEKTETTEEKQHENSKIVHEISTLSHPNMEKNIEASTEYFNKRYNLYPNYYNNTIRDGLAQSHSYKEFNQVNTKHFVKITRHYAL